MKKMFVVFVVALLQACNGDPVSPVVTEPVKVVSSKTVTCSNGQNAAAVVIEPGNRTYVSVNFCVSKTVTGFDGQVTRSTLQTERFVFDDPRTVWSMGLAESIGGCMTTNNGNPLCYYPYL